MDPIYVDMLRVAHLSFFAAGMGTSLYYDFRTFSSINDPIAAQDIAALEHLHGWVSAAFGGLWVTGLALIYLRTGFDLDAFSPKLWLKVTLMVLMTLNAQMISAFVIPLLKRHTGRRIIDFQSRDLIWSTQIGITSMFCWTSGMVLGSSAYLKVAPWEVLAPLAVGWFVLCSVAGHSLIGLMRLRGNVTSDVRNETSDVWSQLATRLQ